MRFGNGMGSSAPRCDHPWPIQELLRHVSGLLGVKGSSKRWDPRPQLGITFSTGEADERPETTRLGAETETWAAAGAQLWSVPGEDSVVSTPLGVWWSKRPRKQQEATRSNQELKSEPFVGCTRHHCYITTARWFLI